MNGTPAGLMNFDLHYEWQPCGGILTGPSHIIRPPQNVAYPKSCVWHSKFEDPDAVISMSITRINLGSCEKGYIIIK